LDGRKTTIQFDDYISDPFPVLSGLEQGCTASPLWFLFSSSDLIEDDQFEKDELGTAFMDDTYLAARANT
ncbi:hypothetical protein FIBSPDRAFT_693647, partial [Athelia psychrophila]